MAVLRATLLWGTGQPRRSLDPGRALAPVSSRPVSSRPESNRHVLSHLSSTARTLVQYRAGGNSPWRIIRLPTSSLRASSAPARGGWFAARERPVARAPKPFDEPSIEGGSTARPRQRQSRSNRSPRDVVSLTRWPAPDAPPRVRDPREAARSLPGDDWPTRGPGQLRPRE
jgi:hypothetical protein